MGGPYTFVVTVERTKPNEWNWLSAVVWRKLDDKATEVISADWLAELMLSHGFWPEFTQKVCQAIESIKEN